jgi:hypothetical protein
MEAIWYCDRDEQIRHNKVNFCRSRLSFIKKWCDNIKMPFLVAEESTIYWKNTTR